MDAKIQGIHVYMARKHARARRLHEETKQSNEHIATEYAEMPPSGSLVKRCNVRVALGGSHLWVGQGKYALREADERQRGAM
jgi:hypothetical protein